VCTLARTRARLSGAMSTSCRCRWRTQLQKLGRATAMHPQIDIVLLLFLQKQNLANAIYLFGLGTLLSNFE
jgi:hypothetical protein